MSRNLKAGAIAVALILVGAAIHSLGGTSEDRAHRDPDRLGPRAEHSQPDSGATLTQTGSEFGRVVESLESPVVLLDEAGVPTSTSLEELWATTMPLDEVHRLAQLRVFWVSDVYRAAFHEKRASMIETYGREGLAKKLGREISPSMLVELEGVEEPYNTDIRALCDLYLDDYEYALKEIYATRQFTIEDRKEDGSFRPALPGESMAMFPGRAIYYRFPEDRFPHLETTQGRIQDVVNRRYVALYQYIDANQ